MVELVYKLMTLDFNAGTPSLRVKRIICRVFTCFDLLPWLRQSIRDIWAAPTLPRIYFLTALCRGLIPSFIIIHSPLLYIYCLARPYIILCYDGKRHHHLPRRRFLDPPTIIDFLLQLVWTCPKLRKSTFPTIFRRKPSFLGCVSWVAKSIRMIRFGGKIMLVLLSWVARSWLMRP